MPNTTNDIFRYSAFSAVLASAGIPLYIHLPAFLSETYGIGLAALGGVLIILRCLDFIQDPLLGAIVGKSRRSQSIAALLSVGALALGMLGIFVIASPFAPLAWISVGLALAFTGYSALTILLYSDGVSRAHGHSHVSLATAREGGALTGILLASMLPFVLPGDGYAGFAMVFAAALVFAYLGMRGRWYSTPLALPSFRELIANDALRSFMVLAFLNSLPVAVTSTLFVFFVELRLGAPALTGPFLMSFFGAAALSVLVWKPLALKLGASKTLLIGMILAILSFCWAFLLPQGASVLFFVVCILSGASLGADMILLPAMFSSFQARSNQNPAIGFGLWSFANKASLAIAAGVVLPLLSLAGFDPNRINGSQELFALGLSYALLPAALKLLAIWWLWRVMHPKGLLDQAGRAPSAIS